MLTLWVFVLCVHAATFICFPNTFLLLCVSYHCLIELWTYSFILLSASWYVVGDLLWVGLLDGSLAYTDRLSESLNSTEPLHHHWESPITVSPASTIFLTQYCKSTVFVKEKLLLSFFQLWCFCAYSITKRFCFIHPSILLGLINIPTSQKKTACKYGVNWRVISLVWECFPEDYNVKFAICATGFSSAVDSFWITVDFQPVVVTSCSSVHCSQSSQNLLSLKIRHDHELKVFYSVIHKSFNINSFLMFSMWIQEAFFRQAGCSGLTTHTVEYYVYNISFLFRWVTLLDH